MRDWHFELLRLVSMLLIVATHFFAADNWPVRTDSALTQTWGASIQIASSMIGQVGVALFMLISAYFLAFSTSNPCTRLVKLWTQVFIYSFGLLVLFSLIQDTSIVPKQYRIPIHAGAFISHALPIIFNEYWFVSAYFVVVLLAPFANKLLDSLSFHQSIVLTVIMLWITFGWRLINPSIDYFSNLIYLFSIYLIGAMIRRQKQHLPDLRIWQTAIITIACCILCIAGTHFLALHDNIAQKLGYPINLLAGGEGSSPILAVIMATAIFICMVRNLPTKTHRTILTDFIVRIAPATFGVYLLHEHNIWKPILWHYVFSMEQPAGIAGKALFAIISILVVYILLLAVCYVIHICITHPVCVFSEKIIMRISSTSHTITRS